jgi:hypothetical protein
VDHLWFRAKSYGWGWTPVSVEGWLVLGLFLVGVGIDVAVLIYRQQHGSDPRRAMISFLVWLGILVAALIAICFMTGERPRWRWGD